jgi:heterodisulfide reductase subunit A
MSHIGLVVCDCGNTLFTQEDAARIASEVKCHGKPCESFFHLTTLCQEEEGNSFAQTLREKDIKQLVFAGCSPSQNQVFLENIASQAGLTPNAIYGVNIKEQLLLHSTNREHALNQAIQSIQKAVTALSEIPVFETKQVPLQQRVLVIGGGIAGIYAAQEIHRFGYPTVILEHTAEIGGQSFPNYSNETLSSEKWRPSQEMIAGIDILTKSSLIELTGHIGNFSATIRTSEGDKTGVQCGAVVVASGSRIPSQISQSAHIFALHDIDMAIADLVKRKGVRSIGLILDRDCDESKASTEMALKLAPYSGHETLPSQSFLSGYPGGC